jgi:hypothetical protein
MRKWLSKIFTKKAHLPFEPKTTVERSKLLIYFLDGMMVAFKEEA